MAANRALSILLRSLGVTVEEQHLEAVETIIPQIPARLNQTVAFINATAEKLRNEVNEIRQSMKSLDNRSIVIHQQMLLIESRVIDGLEKVQIALERITLKEMEQKANDENQLLLLDPMITNNGQPPAENQSR